MAVALRMNIVQYIKKYAEHVNDIVFFAADEYLIMFRVDVLRTLHEDVALPCEGHIPFNLFLAGFMHPSIRILTYPPQAFT